MANLGKRFQIVNVAHRAIGPRKGLLRRRQVGIRSKLIGEARDIETAAQILAGAQFYADEAVFVYDMEDGGRTCGAKYGWEWAQ